MDAAAEIPRRRHTEVLIEKTQPRGKSVVDVGCGDGSLVRALAAEGALALGLEISKAQLAKALQGEPVEGADFLAGQAEHLPLPDASMDVVVLFNSLHHVERHKMDAALEEGSRVLKPGGLLYVAEPLAEGSNFEVVRHFDDETQVRAAAYRALERAAAARDLEELCEERYLTSPAYDSFAAFREQMLRIEPQREAAFRAYDAVIQEEFERLGTKDGKGRTRFDQPMRVNVLRKAG
jgi:ubiquinone/menaquinone biosynthesis C-methylase UbiE